MNYLETQKFSFKKIWIQSEKSHDIQTLLAMLMRSSKLPSLPPVAQPFVHRHSKQKGNHGRDISKFIRVAAAGTINAEGQSVASGL